MARYTIVLLIKAHTAVLCSKYQMSPCINNRSLPFRNFLFFLLRKQLKILLLSKTEIIHKPICMFSLKLIISNCMVYIFITFLNFEKSCFTGNEYYSSAGIEIANRRLYLLQLSITYDYFGELYFLYGK